MLPYVHELDDGAPLRGAVRLLKDGRHRLAGGAAVGPEVDDGRHVGGGDVAHADRRCFQRPDVTFRTGSVFAKRSCRFAGALDGPCSHEHDGYHDDGDDRPAFAACSCVVRSGTWSGWLRGGGASLLSHGDQSIPAISAALSTLPWETTLPSTTSAGVAMTPAAAMVAASDTWRTAIGLAMPSTAALAFSSN